MAEFREYSKKDFLETTEPFEILYQYKDNEFVLMQMVEQMAEMVRKNVAVVGQAVTEIDKITHVVNANAEISESSKQISTNMADITERLLNIVGQ